MEKNLSPAAIKAQTNRILASDGFLRSERMRSFLRFVVDASLNDQTERVKAYTIATEVFGRQVDFDPQGDPIVRIEAGRLRRRLEYYYGTEGRNDAILIDIPKGAYVAVFNSRSLTGDAAVIASRTTASPPQEKLSADLRKRPTLAIMPIVNLNNDADLDFFIYGLGEELSINLSLIQGFSVVAHYSMMQYKGKTPDLKTVGLGQRVDYLITGSLYRGEQNVRLAFQLNNAQTGLQLWGNTIEIPCTASNLFNVRDSLTQRVVSSVAGNYGGLVQTLWSASRGKPPKSLTAYEAVLRHYFYNLQLTSETFTAAKKALEHSVTIDPGYAKAWAMLGEIYCDLYIYAHFGKAKDKLQKVAECVEKSITIDPYCQYAHYTKSLLSVLQKDRPAAITAAEKMIDLNPNAAFMVGAAAVFFSFAGEYERGIKYMKISNQMSPVCPGWFQFVPFVNAFLDGKYLKALLEANKINMPGWFWDPLFRAATLGHMGRIKQAQSAYDELLIVNPDFEKNPAYFIQRVLMDDVLIDGLVKGLYKAGLPKIKCP